MFKFSRKLATCDQEDFEITVKQHMAKIQNSKSNLNRLNQILKAKHKCERSVPLKCLILYDPQYPDDLTMYEHGDRGPRSIILLDSIPHAHE